MDEFAAVIESQSEIVGAVEEDFSGTDGIVETEGAISVAGFGDPSAGHKYITIDPVTKKLTLNPVVE